MHSEAGNRVDTHSTSPARATVALRRERVVCQAVYCDPCYVMACGCATHALLATITSHNTSAGLVCRVPPYEDELHTASSRGPFVAGSRVSDSRHGYQAVGLAWLIPAMTQASTGRQCKKFQNVKPSSLPRKPCHAMTHTAVTWYMAPQLRHSCLTRTHTHAGADQHSPLCTPSLPHALHSRTPPRQAAAPVVVVVVIVAACRLCYV